MRDVSKKSPVSVLRLTRFSLVDRSRLLLLFDRVQKIITP